MEVKIHRSGATHGGHSYAGALHPYTLLLLDQLGLAEEVLKAGRRLDAIGFCEGGSRRAEIRLSELSAKFPFLMVLPQSRLESLLETALSQRAGVKVNWKRRFSTLRAA